MHRPVCPGRNPVIFPERTDEMLLALISGVFPDRLTFTLVFFCPCHFDTLGQSKLSEKIITERDQKRHRRRADHAVKHGQNYGLPVCIPDHHGKSSIFTGGACRGDAGEIIQFP